MEKLSLFDADASEGEFDLFETEHFLIATEGRVRPQGFAETAERLYREAHATRTRLASGRREELIGLINLGSLAAERGDLESAAERLERARTLGERLAASAGVRGVAVLDHPAALAPYPTAASERSVRHVVVGRPFWTSS